MFDNIPYKAFVGDLEQQASELKISTKLLKINYHY